MVCIILWWWCALQCCNTFAVSHCVVDFENAPQCGRRMRKREVATQLYSFKGGTWQKCRQICLKIKLHWKLLNVINWSMWSYFKCLISSQLIVIIRLVLSLLIWPNVFTLRGFYCTSMFYYFWTLICKTNNMLWIYLLCSVLKTTSKNIQNGHLI